MDIKIDEKVAKLNEQLLQTYINDKELFDKLTKVQSDLGLLFNDRPTCPFLRPHFLTRTQYSEIAHAAEMIADAEKRLTYAALEDEELLERNEAEDALNENKEQSATVEASEPETLEEPKRDGGIQMDDKDTEQELPE